MGSLWQNCSVEAPTGFPRVLLHLRKWDVVKIMSHRYKLVMNHHPRPFGDPCGGLLNNLQGPFRFGRFFSDGSYNWHDFFDEVFAMAVWGWLAPKTPKAYHVLQSDTSKKCCVPALGMVQTKYSSLSGPEILQPQGLPFSGMIAILAGESLCILIL